MFSEKVNVDHFQWRSTKYFHLTKKTQFRGSFGNASLVQTLGPFSELGYEYIDFTEKCVPAGNVINSSGGSRGGSWGSLDPPPPLPCPPPPF